MIDCGVIRRWREGDILWAENDLVRMCYVQTDDRGKIGTEGWHGPQQIRLEYVGAETAKLWDA